VLLAAAIVTVLRGVKRQFCANAGRERDTSQGGE
jgi:hypothetical protein